MADQVHRVQKPVLFEVLSPVDFRASSPMPETVSMVCQLVILWIGVLILVLPCLGGGIF